MPKRADTREVLLGTSFARNVPWPATDLDCTKLIKPGDTIIGPGDRVDAIFQLLHGRIDMVRDLGTAEEERTIFERAHEKDWAPILGGRYFFNGEHKSSMHYLAVTPCTITEIGPEHIEGMYSDGNVASLIRDIIRRSDMNVEVIRSELARRYAMTGDRAFNIDSLDGLLQPVTLGKSIQYVPEDFFIFDPERQLDEYYAETRDVMKFGNDTYVEFARNILLQLLSGQVVSSAESKSIKITLQPCM
jgi:hypothetical protein